jgi:hypothetical protein
MLRGMDRWLPGYLLGCVRRARTRVRPRHILLCVADHFEPLDRNIAADGSVGGGIDPARALASVEDWCNGYRACVGALRDADGRPPRHTFFYPWDEYDASCVDCLAAFCREGFGEVEIHLHHRHDDAARLRGKLVACRDTLAKTHGLLGRRADGRPGYAFVHGNWALCDSRPDGDWCGVRQELAVLAETGCYADLTFPSAPSATQPRVINAPFYGRDPQVGERGVQRADWVRAASVAPTGSPGGVMMIPGPLGLNWRRRKWGVLPRLENAELSGVNPPTTDRLRVWLRIGVAVAEQADWVAIKLHTHGMAPANRNLLLGARMAVFHRALLDWCREEGGCALHYVTARELFNIMTAAAGGPGGNPDLHRNRGIAAPPALRRT